MLEILSTIILLVVTGGVVTVVISMKRKYNLIAKNLHDIQNGQVALKLDQAKLNANISSLRYYLNKSNIDLYRQLKAAEGIDGYIGAGHTAKLRGWALSPDALILQMRYIDQYKPKAILEIGSGYSTHILASYVKRLGLDTHIISVDHDPEYYERTRYMVSDYDNVTVVRAPLRDYGDYSWYDDDVIKKVVKGQKIKLDLILVDGPPEDTNSKARQPVFAHMRSLLASRFTIILDDADRKDERAAVEEWVRIDNNLKHHYIYTEKGLSVLSSVKDFNINSIY